MSEENNKIINGFKEYGIWLETLNSIEEAFWIAPTSEGKWSIGEIVILLIGITIYYFKYSHL